MTTLPPIAELNASPRDAFFSAVNTLFETAPPLADRLYAARPFASYARLIDYSQALVLGDDLNRDEKIEIINAHPRIGENPANLSALSLKEQGYEERTISPEEREVNETLARLNEVGSEVVVHFARKNVSDFYYWSLAYLKLVSC